MKDKFKNDEINNNEKAKIIRHPLAHVVIENTEMVIESTRYKILANVKDGLDLDLLQEKYDPFLDQYDYLVGDISSDHLRLKGFYDTNEHVIIDKKANVIVDYLEEYCNPGSAYFVLQRMGDNPIKKIALGRQNKKRQYQSKKHKYKKNYSEKKVNRTKFKTKNHLTAKTTHKAPRNKSFVIRKRKG